MCRLKMIGVYLEARDWAFASDQKTFCMQCGGIVHSYFILQYQLPHTHQVI